MITTMKFIGQAWDLSTGCVGGFYIGRHLASLLWWLTHHCDFCKKRYRRARSNSDFKMLYCSMLCQRCDIDVPDSIRIREVTE